MWRSEPLMIWGVKSATRVPVRDMKRCKTYRLQHAGTLSNLGRDGRVEEGLHEHNHGAVLGLDAELLGLDVHVNVIHRVDAALLSSLLLDPLAQLVVDRVATALALLVIVVVQDELCLEVARKR